MNNGKTLSDVSTIGDDHMNEVDLNDIQQIEIVRGPSSLLYSSGTVGGIVNIIDNTIAREDFKEPKLNIGLESVILEIVAKSGLDENKANDIIKNRKFKSSVDKDWEKSRTYGVTGVPTYVYNNHSVVGAQPIENLVEFLNHFGVPKL